MNLFHANVTNVPMEGGGVKWEWSWRQRENMYEPDASFDTTKNMLLQRNLPSMCLTKIPTKISSEQFVALDSLFPYESCKPLILWRNRDSHQQIFNVNVFIKFKELEIVL